MQVTLRSMQTRISGLLVAGFLLACAEGRDETRVQPAPGASGGGTGGTGGATGGGSGGAGSGGGGDGGSGGEIRDASVDALDARTLNSPCQSLDVYCSGDSRAFIALCPDLASNRVALGQTRLNRIVERRCVGEDGAPRVGVHASIGPQYVTTLVYDPATGQLVGADFLDDVEYGCFGELSADCGSRAEPFFEGCDGGAQGLNASDAAGFECIVPEPDASAP
jgi:hypothetical protein